MPIDIPSLAMQQPSLDAISEISNPVGKSPEPGREVIRLASTYG